MVKKVDGCVRGENAAGERKVGRRGRRLRDKAVPSQLNTRRDRGHSEHFIICTALQEAKLVCGSSWAPSKI
eukprot:6202186-Pleurochrysis_carterae.AAC.5